MSLPSLYADPDFVGAWQSFLIEQSQDALYTLDMQGQVVSGNACFAALLGREPADLLLQRVWDWDLDLPREPALALLAQDQAWRCRCWPACRRPTCGL